MTVTISGIDFTENGDKIDAEIIQGKDINFFYTITDDDDNNIDVTNYKAGMQVRVKPDDSSTILSLTVGSGITVGGTNGVISFSISDTVTADLTPGLYVYDIEIVNDNGDILPGQSGNFRVKPEVTKVSYA